MKLFHTFQIEDSSRQGAEYASKVARIMVKLKYYDEAADAIRREIGLHQQVGSDGAIGRLAVGLVLVQLARGDYVAAEKAFKEWGNCCDVAEVQTLESLLQVLYKCLKMMCALKGLTMRPRACDKRINQPSLVFAVVLYGGKLTMLLFQYPDGFD